MVSSRKIRQVRALTAEAIFDWRENGTIYVKSPRALGAYPVKLTERLEQWATEAPERVFLAQRNDVGLWRTVTYAAALERTRSIAQALVDRGLNDSTPVMILSGNSIEHALLALGCMYAGVLYAPISPSYALASNDLTTLRYLWQKLQPALVFAYDGAAFEKPLAAILDERTELVTVKTPASARATSFDELISTPVRSSVEEAHARVTADTIAKVLFTSGSTGSPQGCHHNAADVLFKPADAACRHGISGR